MLVYRLETIERNGPFDTDSLWDFVDSLHYCNSERYPTTYVAFSESDHDKIAGKLHGCLSLRQLLYWFPAKVIRQMRGKGFGVAVYEVNRSQVIFGKFQLLFDLTHAKRVRFK